MEDLLASLGVALLFLALGIPLVLGKVRRNNFYGARFPATLADDRVWDVVNRKTGLVFVVGGAAAVIVDLLAIAGLITQGIALYVIGGLTVYALVASAWLWRYSEQVARDGNVEVGDREIGRGTPLLVATGCFIIAVVGALSMFSTPNPSFGFRVPATLNNPVIWHEVNFKAGLTLAVLSGVFGFLFLGLSGSPESERKRLFPGLLIGWVAAIAIVGVAGTLFANSLVR